MVMTAARSQLLARLSIGDLGARLDAGGDRRAEGQRERVQDVPVLPRSLDLLDLVAKPAKQLGGLLNRAFTGGVELARNCGVGGHTDAKRPGFACRHGGERLIRRRRPGLIPCPCY